MHCVSVSESIIAGTTDVRTAVQTGLIMLVPTVCTYMYSIIFFFCSFKPQKENHEKTHFQDLKYQHFFQQHVTKKTE